MVVIIEVKERLLSGTSICRRCLSRVRDGLRKRLWHCVEFATDLVIIEAMFIGLLDWGIGIVLDILLSWYLGQTLGEALSSGVY